MPNPLRSAVNPGRGWQCLVNGFRLLPANNRIVDRLRIVERCCLSIAWVAGAVTVSALIAQPVQAAETVMVGLDSNDAYPPNSTAAGRVAVSANGRYMAFQARGAYAAPLESGVQHIFWRDLVTGQTENIHVGPDGAAGNENAWLPSISDDGQLIAFVSLATNLGSDDPKGWPDIFLYNRQTTTLNRVTVRVTQSDNPFPQFPVPYISGDGSTIAFATDEEEFGFDGDDSDTVYLYDVATGVFSSPSFDANGRRLRNGVNLKGISDDGDKLLITTRQSLDPLDQSSHSVYLYNRINDSFTWLTQNAVTNSYSAGLFGASMTGDARHVVFSSVQPFVAEDTDAALDFMLRNIETGETRVVTVDENGVQIADQANAFDPAISADGQLVAFSTLQPGFVAGAPDRIVNMYVYDNAAQKTQVISTLPDGSFSDRGANGIATFATAGRYVFFGSGDGALDSERDESVGGGTALYRVDRGLSCTGPQGQSLTVDVEPVDWYQLAIPCVAPDDANTLQAILADDLSGTYGDDWVAFVYETGPTPGYRKLALTDILQPGTSFWLQHQGSDIATLDMPSGSRSVATNFNQRSACLSDTGCYTISAAATGTAAGTSWSMNGNPLINPGGAALGNLRVTTDTGTCSLEGGCTLEAAQTADVALDTIFSWQGGDSYQLLSAESGLPTWRGAWFGALPGAAGNAAKFNFPETDN